MKMNEVCEKAQKPTIELVKMYLKKDDSTKQDSLQRLINEEIFNKEKYETILLTAIVINELYSTNIYNIIQMADHIYSKKDEIHVSIEKGDSKAVELIATGHGIKNSRSAKEMNFYSFATKYCNYFNSKEFPIFDSYVENMLCMYNKKSSFAQFKSEELRKYSKFKEVLQEFINKYQLQSFSLREVDIFLWTYGKELFA